MFYAEYIRLCNEAGKTPSAVAEELGFKKSAVTKWKQGSIPTDANKNKIAQYFNISVAELLGDEQKETPALTEKDERDISKMLQKALNALEEQQDGIMFDGEPIDDATRELLEISLRNSMEMGKKIAKQKFTPKKYRK